MSHDLAVNEKTGKAAFVHSEYQPAWHGLGINFGRLMDKEELLEMSGLDYEVVKKPLYMHRNLIRADGAIKKRYMRVPRTFETIRTDTEQHLGVVGDRYEPYQNDNAFNIFEEIVTEGSMIYESAGVISDGRIMWVMGKMPDYVKVKGDPIEKFLLFTNSHDGTSPITIALTPIRVVCHNTLRFALGFSGSSLVKVRHTKNAQERVSEARRVLKITSEYYRHAKEYFGEMAGFKMNASLINKYFKLVLPDPVAKGGDTEAMVAPARTENTRKQLVDIFETSETINEVKATKGTLYGAYNAVTEYVDHYKTIRGDREDRFEHLIINQRSGSSTLRQKAFDASLNILN